MTAPTIGPDSYPMGGDVHLGRRVWDVEELDPIAEGHGLPAWKALTAHLTLMHGDEGARTLTARAREGWALFRTVCPCPEPEDCEGGCDCGGYLAPCGDEWAWQVLSVVTGTPGAVPVTWSEA